MKREAEKRFITRADLRMKPAADGTASNILQGYALRYNSFSEDLGGFKEVLKPGAFAESLKTADVRALIDHKSELLLGRTSSGTLKLADDEDGLAFEDDLPDVSYARDLKVTVGRGDKDGMSFGFYCLEAEWSAFPGDEDTGLVLRTIVRAEIFEISCVTFPAYTETSAAMRSLERYRAEHAPRSATSFEAEHLRFLTDLAARRSR